MVLTGLEPLTPERTEPDYINDEPYDRILIIVNMISGGVAEINWENIDIYGATCTFNPNLKIDYTGKLGIGT